MVAEREDIGTIVEQVIRACRRDTIADSGVFRIDDCQFNTVCLFEGKKFFFDTIAAAFADYKAFPEFRISYIIF